MIDYSLPEFKFPNLRPPKFSFLKKERINFTQVLISSIIISSLFGFLAGAVSGTYFYNQIKDYLSQLPLPQKITERETIIEKEYVPQTSQEQAIIQVVDEVSPAVVSIIITKDLPIIEEYYTDPFEGFEEFFGEEFKIQIPQYRQEGFQEQEIGAGSGFIVSEDGMILTNKHVVLDEDAEYTVLTSDGKKFSAEVLARDPVQDLAIIKIEGENSFPVVKLGNSDKLQIGQTVVAIGNALSEFQNTVSVGVISGLGRTITASGVGLIETLEDIIQTDAAINRGNSGGPLLNLRGEVIGINTAMSLEGENIGFAIPVNKAKRDIEQVKNLGKIVYAFLGVRYIVIDETIQKENDLPVDYGALIVRGEEPGETAIFPGSVAEEAGLKNGDIILELNGERITTDNSLAKIIMKYSPGDSVILKVLIDEEEKNIEVILGERSE